MKEIKILFASYLLDTVVSEIKEYGVERYLVVGKLTGEWGPKLKHFDNHVWPGTDSMVLIIVEDDVAREILEGLRQIRKDLGATLTLGAIVTDVHDILF